MTGYTVHTGSNLKFASNWDQIFSGKKKGKSPHPSALDKGQEAAEAASTEKKRAKKNPSPENRAWIRAEALFYQED